ncbi:MAG: hypothetical protein WA945_07010 [Arcobacteraceae bacterium]
MDQYYSEDYTIKYGHIRNVALKNISVKDLENLKVKLAHDKQLVNAITKVIKQKNTINIEEELVKLKSDKIDNKPPTSKSSDKKVRDKVTIPDDFILTNGMIEYAQKNQIEKKDTIHLFENFTKYYQEKQFKSRDWLRLWHDWVDKNIGFKYFEKNNYSNDEYEFAKPITGEKYPYIFKSNAEYFKVEAISNKIKETLTFEYKIDWLNDYYWKDIPIKNIGWQKCKHPFKQYDQIILYFKDDELSVNEMQEYIELSPSSECTQEEFDSLVIKSNANKKYVKEKTDKNWEEFYTQNISPSPDTHHFVEMTNPSNPTQKEILLIKIENSPQGN